MRVLVAAASKHGSTRDIGETITTELQAMGLDAEYHAVEDVRDLAGYSAVILGSAIYMGNWLETARTFADSHADELQHLPVWLFSSGPLGVDNVVSDDASTRIQQVADALHAQEHRLFAGRLDPADLGFGEKLILKVVHAPTGDFREWDDIAEWARSIGAQLQVS